MNTPGTSFSGIPATSASTSETARIARNGCTLHFEIKRIIATIAMTNAMINDSPVITICKFQLFIRIFVFYGRKHSP